MLAMDLTEKEIIIQRKQEIERRKGKRMVFKLTPMCEF